MGVDFGVEQFNVCLFEEEEVLDGERGWPYTAIAMPDGRVVAPGE